MAEPGAVKTVTRDVAWQDCNIRCDREGFCFTAPVPDSKLSADLSVNATPVEIRAYFEKAAKQLQPTMACKFGCRGITYWVKPTPEELAAALMKAKAVPSGAAAGVVDGREKCHMAKCQ